MYMANDEQSKLAKLIREFKNKTRPPHNSKLRQVKEDVINRECHFIKEEKWCLKHLHIFEILRKF